MKIFFAGVFHHFSNWLLNLRAASCDASSKMKTFVGNNFQLSLSQHDFSLWWIEDLLLGVFSDMEDWKGQILGILKKIKVNCTIIRLWDKFNNSFYEVKHSSSLARRFYPYVNILLCFVFQDQCIAMYHIFEVHLSHIFCWRKKVKKSLYIVVLRSTRLQSSGLQTYSMITMELGIVYKKLNSVIFLERGLCFLCQCHIFMNQAKQRSSHISLFFFVVFESY